MTATDLPPATVVDGAAARPDAAPFRAEPVSRSAAPAAAVARALRGEHQRRGFGLTARHVLAVSFAVAWLACPLIEPMPTGHVPAYPLWQLPIDVAAIGTIILAVGALWRGSPRAPRLGIAAGVMMAVETIVCPYAGHTPIGWWTWVQAGLSLFVLFTSAALQARQRP
jgi:hypothetical protein